MQKVAAVLVVALAAARIPAAAQVAARQGAAPPPEEVHFASPMILDLPLPDVASLAPGASLRLAEVRKYICDTHGRVSEPALLLAREV